jgi:formate dehydrogenase subunit gamma
MATMRALPLLLVAGLSLGLIAGAIAPALAQQQQKQPTEVNPTAQSVKEQQLLRELSRIQGRSSLPDARSAVIEQPGRDWRQFHQVTLPWVATISILGMLAVLVLFYLIRGMVRIEGGRSGRTLVRFNAFERFVHWMTASCFIVLAVSGLNITFGREILTPWVGPEAFATWSQWAKYAHNFLSFPFTIGVALMFLLWIAWNFPASGDGKWIAQGGGIVGSKHPPARRFNAGQKAIYWVVVLGGGAAAITGYLLMFPFYGTGVAGMQLAQMYTGSWESCSSPSCWRISTLAPSACRVRLRP